MRVKKYLWLACDCARYVYTERGISGLLYLILIFHRVPALTRWRWVHGQPGRALRESDSAS